jgi:arylsulfatase A-like enzyme
VIFETALSPAAWTLPAHASLLTGLYPDRHGATDPRRRIAQDVPTLAQELRQAGLETVAFTDGGYVDRRFGFAAGFDRYDDWVRDPGSRPALDLPRNGAHDPQLGSALFDRAIAYLEQRHPDGPPFFLFLQTYAVHDYFRVEPEAVRALAGEQFGGGKYYLKCLVGRRDCSMNDRRQLRALYAAEVANLDLGLGHLLSTLDRCGLTDSTLVIFVSDHGEGFDFARGRIHHGGRLHQDLIRVPLLIAGPGATPARVREPVSLVDVMPTVLDLLGRPSTAGLDGESLAPVLRRERPPRTRPLYAMEYYMWWEGGRRLSSEEVRQQAISVAAIARGRWYIQAASGDEIYDLEADAGQRRSLIDVDHAGALRDLVSARREYHLPAGTRGPDRPLDARLRALGYVR